MSTLTAALELMHRSDGRHRLTSVTVFSVQDLIPARLQCIAVAVMTSANANATTTGIYKDIAEALLMPADASANMSPRNPAPPI